MTTALDLTTTQTHQEASLSSANGHYHNLRKKLQKWIFGLDEDTTKETILNLIYRHHERIIGIFEREIRKGSPNARIIWQPEHHRFRVENPENAVFWNMPVGSLLIQKGKRFILVSPLDFCHGIIFASGSKYKISRDWVLSCQTFPFGMSLGIQFQRGDEICIIHGRNRATMCDGMKLELHLLEEATLPSQRRGHMDEYHQIEYLSQNYHRIGCDPSGDGKKGMLYTIITTGMNVYHMTALEYTLGEELSLEKPPVASNLHVQFYWVSDSNGTIYRSQRCPLLDKESFDDQFNEMGLWRGTDGHLATEKPKESHHKKANSSDSHTPDTVEIQPSQSSTLGLLVVFYSLRGEEIGEATAPLRHAVLRKFFACAEFSNSLCLMTHIAVSMEALLKKIELQHWSAVTSPKSKSNIFNAAILYSEQDFEVLEESFSDLHTIMATMRHIPSNIRQ